MTTPAVSSPEEETAARPSRRGVAGRTARGFATAGWLALLLGGAVGFAKARPEQLASWLSFNADPVFIGLGGMTLIGLLSGILAGLQLAGAKGSLRFLVALLAVLIGVASAETVEGILRGFSVRDSLVLAPDALEAAGIVLGALGALLGIRADRFSPPEPSTPAAAQEPARAAPSTDAQQVRSRGWLAGLPERIRQSMRSVRLLLPSSSPRPKSRTRSSAGDQVQVTRPRKKRRRPSRRRTRVRSRNNVQLGAEATSVCPYCLEEVKPRDPRGRVVCEICHTPHHADCWAITGKCEVPHLQV